MVCLWHTVARVWNYLDIVLDVCKYQSMVNMKNGR